MPMSARFLVSCVTPYHPAAHGCSSCAMVIFWVNTYNVMKKVNVVEGSWKYVSCRGAQCSPQVPPPQIRICMQANVALGGGETEQDKGTVVPCGEIDSCRVKVQRGVKVDQGDQSSICIPV